LDFRRRDTFIKKGRQSGHKIKKRGYLKEWAKIKEIETFRRGAARKGKGEELTNLGLGESKKERKLKGKDANYGGSIFPAALRNWGQTSAHDV